MQRALAATFGLIATLAVAPACSKQKEQAQAEVAKIEEACKSGDGDKARTLMQEAAKNNELFGRAYEAATNEVTDKSRINACGLVLTEIKTRLQHD